MSFPGTNAAVEMFAHWSLIIMFLTCLFAFWPNHQLIMAYNSKFGSSLSSAVSLFME